MVGPGEPNCKKCGGRGVLRVETAEDLHLQRGTHPPSYRRCPCVLRRDIIANVDRGMRGLSSAPVVKESPLPAHLENDLWITASRTWFRAHLRHIAIRQPPQWYFKVITDADLMTAWLASVALKGKEILDPDAAKVSLTHLTLVDLVMPPTLLIVRLGVKQARNVASPEVLLEALRSREHEGKPTWVWDTPLERLTEGHTCFSVYVRDYLSDWAHLGTASQSPIQSTGTHQDLVMDTPPREQVPEIQTDAAPQKPTLGKRSPRKTLRGDGSGS